MKKFFTSLIFVLIFAGYGLQQHFGNASQMAPIVSDITPTTQLVDTGIQTSLTPTPPPPPSTNNHTPTPVPTPTPTPPPTPRGQYIDGSYTGGVADAYYGYVQVRVTVRGGKMTDVAFLQYPNDRNTSRYINSQAMPILRSEAIQAQSAQVDTVSGASATSGAFQQSLADALSQARA